MTGPSKCGDQVSSGGGSVVAGVGVVCKPGGGVVAGGIVWVYKPGGVGGLHVEENAEVDASTPAANAEAQLPSVGAVAAVGGIGGLHHGVGIVWVYKPGDVGSLHVGCGVQRC